MFVRTILLAIFMAFVTAYATAGTASNPSDRQIATRWVKKNAHEKLSTARARFYVDLAYKEARKQELDPKLVLSIMKTESGFKARARSGYGAVGLMQVYPPVHQDKLKGKDPYHVPTNVAVGTKILKDCIRRKGNMSAALSCYSGGATNYHQKVVAFKRSLEASNRHS